MPNFDIKIYTIFYITNKKPCHIVIQCDARQQLGATFVFIKSTEDDDMKEKGGGGGLT